MIGFLTLSEPVCCKKEVLGKKFVSNMTGFQVQICFPNCPEIDENNPEIGITNPLLPPDGFAGWKKGDEPLTWGYPMAYPSCNSSVELLALKIECEKEQADDCASTLYNTIQDWEYAFLDYLKLKTRQNTERDRNIKRNECRLILYEEKRIPDRSPLSLCLSFPQDDWHATEEDIIDAITFADSGKEFLPEYQLLLSAYDARRNNQNRRAILDACAAIEIALDKQIEDHCKLIGLNSDILLNKYQSLGDKFPLLAKLGVNFPRNDYKDIIAKPRNDVIHNRKINPSDDTIDEIIKHAEVILNHFYQDFY